MACMTENSEATPWSMQTEVVSTNLCHFLDNHKMEVITLQQITGKGSVQAVYKWIWGNGFPSIDAFYLICDKFSNEGIHIEDFLRKDGIGCMYPYMDYTPRTLEEIIRSAHKNWWKTT